MKKILLTVAFAFSAAGLHAQDLTYDYATNPGWFAPNAWTPGPTTWSAGANATMNATSTKAIAFSGSTTIGNLTVTGGGGFAVDLGTDATPATLTFSGGTINTLPVIETELGTSIQGNFTSTGGGVLRFNTSTTAYSGTATINAGRFEVAAATTVGANSHVTINTGGVFDARNTNTYNLGNIVINGGTFELSRTNANTTIIANLTSLSGSGGNTTVLLRTTGTLGVSNATLNINQSTNTTYSGTITGFTTAFSGTQTGFITVNKLGAGSLALGGNIDLRRETTVTAGTLLINSTNATFTSTSANAITVNGTLGGTGTLQITGADSVTLTGNGSLLAGLAGSAGQTTYNLSGGSLDLTTRTSGAGTGWLNFDLGTNATPGTTYDRISLTGSGALNIGTGLNFTDFTFSTLSGFGSGGNYTLFSTTSAILGTLGTTTGTISGLNATLQISGNDLVLNVVPEPATWGLLAASLTTVMVLRRRRRNP